MKISELYQLYRQNPSVQTDTRKLKQNDIFFALSGLNFDGNAFAQKAIEMGASFAVIDNPEFALNEKYIVVENTLKTLQELARYHRQQFRIPFLAITGSNGKTTTKELVAAVLSRKYVTYATEGNLNNHIGVPLTLLKNRSDAQMAIIEMGANHLNEIAGYCEIAMPTHGLITNCGKAHIEGFGSLENVRKAKGELYDYLRQHSETIFRNADLDYLTHMSEGIDKQITYGSEHGDYIGKPKMDDVLLSVEYIASQEKVELNTNLVGIYNFPNVMAAIAVGLHFGVSINEIKTALQTYLPDNSRSQLIQRGSNKIILDAYNANPSSMREAIQNFANSNLLSKNLWIGGMKEMGSEEEHEHYELIELIAKYKWENVILVGKEFSKNHKDYLWFENSVLAAEYIKANLPSNSSILIKGSRGSKMELMLEVV